MEKKSRRKVLKAVRGEEVIACAVWSAPETEEATSEATVVAEYTSKGPKYPQGTNEKLAAQMFRDGGGVKAKAHWCALTGRSFALTFWSTDICRLP